MYGYVYSNITNAAKADTFTSRGNDAGAFVVGVVLLIVVVVVHLFVVKSLWNIVLVRTLSIAKPLPSLLYTLGLLVLLGLLFPGPM